MDFHQKPSSRGLFFFLLLLVATLLPTVAVPGFFYPAPVSQLFWALLFVDLLALAALFGHGKVLEFPVGWWVGGLLGGLGLLVAGNLHQAPTAAAVAVLFGLLLLLGATVLDRTFCLQAVSVSTLVHALVGLAQFHGVKLGVWSPGIGIYPGRLTGPFNQPNLTAAFLLLGLFAYLQLLQEDRRRPWLGLLPALVIALALFLTGSRAGFLALVLALLLVLHRYWKGGALRESGGFLARTLLAVAVAYLGARGVASLDMVDAAARPGLDRTLSSLAEMSGDQAAYQRFNYWFTGLLIGLDHPWFGAGIGRYKELLGDYMLPAAEMLHLTYDSFNQTLWPHNDFLHVLAEAGLPLTLLMVLLCLALLYRSWRGAPTQWAFVFGALAGFAVCMMFGHPFRYSATLFAFLLLAGQALARGGRARKVPRLPAALILVPLLLWVNVALAGHFQRMATLKETYEALGNMAVKTPSALATVWDSELEEALEDDLYGWMFRQQLLDNLVHLAWTRKDRNLAAWLLPKAVAFSARNRFHSLDYDLALLHYLVGDYDQAKRLAWSAFEKKPDRDIYFDFSHLNNALIISRDNRIPIGRLIGAKEYKMLEDSRIIQAWQFDSRDIVLRKFPKAVPRADP